jgi:cell division protein FtsB
MAAYFGMFALYGERGYAQLLDIRGELTERHAQLAQLIDQRQRLEHRIQLLRAGDPDLVEELARSELMNAGPGQIAVPRQRH